MAKPYIPHGPQGERPPIVHRAGAPRLNVELTEHQSHMLDLLIPRGQRKHVFHAIVDDLIDLLSKTDDRHRLLAFVIGRQISMASIACGLEEKE